MEDAGKAQDIASIKAHTAALLELYRSFETKLACLAHGESDEDSGLPEVDADTLADAYQALSDVIAMMDYDSVEMILASMEEYHLPKEDAGRFQKLGTLLRQFDWEGMEQLLPGSGR